MCAVCMYLFISTLSLRMASLGRKVLAHLTFMHKIITWHMRAAMVDWCNLHVRRRLRGRSSAHSTHNHWRAPKIAPDRSSALAMARLPRAGLTPGIRALCPVSQEPPITALATATKATCGKGEEGSKKPASGSHATDSGAARPTAMRSRPRGVRASV